MPDALGPCQPGTPGPECTDGCPLGIRLGYLFQIQIAQNPAHYYHSFDTFYLKLLLKVSSPKSEI